MRYGENTCRVSEDRIYGKSKAVNKRAIRKFDEDSYNQDRVKTYHHLAKLVQKLSGQISYDSPSQKMPLNHRIGGSFKLRNDPKQNTIT